MDMANQDSQNVLQNKSDKLNLSLIFFTDPSYSLLNLTTEQLQEFNKPINEKNNF